MRQVALYEARTAEDVWALIRTIGARTLVFDVEPLVAVWATDTATLDAGVAETLRLVGELGGGAAGESAGGLTAGLAGESAGGLTGGLAGDLAAGLAGESAGKTGGSGSGSGGGSGGRSGVVVEAVFFATNSVRRPTSLPSLVGVRVGYRASASKPLRIKGYRELPGPGVVIGDQIATDGTLAWRLGFDFVYYRPERDRIPLRPRLLHVVGDGIRPLLFRTGGLPPPFC